MDQAEEAIQDDFTEEAVQEPVESQEEVEEITDEEPEVTEPEYEEIEYNGEKYQVPPELKDAVLRHEDYTKKTQEVAEQRKALEQQVEQFQQVAQAQRENMQGHAQLAAIQSQLEQYQNVDWAQFSENDPQAAQQAFFQYSQLKDAATNLGQTLQRREAQALQQQRAMLARQLEQGKAELARDIPGWSDKTAKEIMSHGASYGFTESELKQVVDPRMVKVLNDARLYRQSLKKATDKPKVEAKPAMKVKGKASGRSNSEPDDMDAWVKWRNKKVMS